MECGIGWGRNERNDAALLPTSTILIRKMVA